MFHEIQQQADRLPVLRDAVSHAGQPRRGSPNVLPSRPLCGQFDSRASRGVKVSSSPRWRRALARAAGLRGRRSPRTRRSATLPTRPPRRWTLPGRTRGGTDIVFVQAGASDVLVQVATLQTSATQQGQAAVTAQVTAKVQSDIAADQCTPTDSQATNCVNSQILANGAKYVTVVNLPDIGTTPFGAALGASTLAVVDAMVSAFQHAAAKRRGRQLQRALRARSFPWPRSWPAGNGRKASGTRSRRTGNATRRPRWCCCGWL